MAGQLNGSIIQTDGVVTLDKTEMYSTTPDMLQHGHELNKFNSLLLRICISNFRIWCRY